MTLAKLQSPSTDDVASRLQSYFEVSATFSNMCILACTSIWHGGGLVNAWMCECTVYVHTLCTAMYVASILQMHKSTTHQTKQPINHIYAIMKPFFIHMQINWTLECFHPRLPTSPIPAVFHCLCVQPLPVVMHNWMAMEEMSFLMSVWIWFWRELSLGCLDSSHCCSFSPGAQDEEGREWIWSAQGYYGSQCR